jgi:hypothetical protein
MEMNIEQYIRTRGVWEWFQKCLFQTSEMQYAKKYRMVHKE